MRSLIKTDDLNVRLRAYAPAGAPDDCWEWTMCRVKDYGMISIGGTKLRGAHIVAWELANGRTVPEGMVVRHTCDNPPCTNPAHLDLGEHADNVHDCIERDRRGGTPSGYRHRTPDEVRAIRAAAARGVTAAELGRRYGMSRVAASRIIKRTAFADIS